MSDKSVTVRVGDVLVAHLCLMKSPELTDNLEEDLDADSLDVIELTLALEDEFAIEINDDTARAFKTMNDIVEYLGGQEIT